MTTLRNARLLAQRMRPEALLLTIVAALTLSIIPAFRVSGHAELVRAVPPPDGLLAAPPRSIELWTTERVATGGGSPAIDVLDQSGANQSVSNVHVDPNDPRHVVADVSGVSTGTYTVVWTVRSDDDGHTLTGSYAFRVGTGRAPGAATVEGESPRVWAVATRWMTFLGAAIAAAGFLFGRFIQPGESEPGLLRKRTLSILIGGAVALIATVSEPFLTTRFPPEGAIKPSLSDAISGLPTAWWIRPVALIAVIGLGIALSVLAQKSAPPPVLLFAGGAVALAAMLGLSLTSHASARESWRFIALPSIMIHQWAVGLWVGGLVQLAIGWPFGKSSTSSFSAGSPATDPVRRFSKYALGLALVGIGTGVLNAGLVLPTLKSLWDSNYGDFLIAKVAILLPVLGLATFHRLKLRQIADKVSLTLKRTVRIEAAIVLAVVLCGSILALSAPPSVAHGDFKFVDLAAPVSESPSDLTVRLQVTPAKPGDNHVTVLVQDSNDALIPPDQIALVRLDFISLDTNAEQREVATTPNPTGGFTSQGVQLSLEGWWEIDVLIRRLGVEDVVVPFYMILPDPNVNGFQTRTSTGNSEAQQIFGKALQAVTSLHSLHWTQRLASGTGAVVFAEYKVSDGTPGFPAAFSLSSKGFEQIQVGDRRWQREPGSAWAESSAPPIYPPSQWGGDYAAATDFHLGRTYDVNGEQTQIVTFFVPGTPQLVAANYAWFISTTTGRLVRETMVSRSHYMVWNYSDFDQPMNITPPTGESPTASPVAGTRIASPAAGN